MRSNEQFLDNPFSNRHDKAPPAMLVYIFVLFCFVGLFICEIDPVIGNDILIFLEGVFIYGYFYHYFKFNENSGFFKELFETKRNILVLFLLWGLGTFLSLILSPILTDLHTIAAQIPRFIGSIVSVLFAYTLWHFLKSQQLNPWILLFTIAFTALITGLNFFLVWNLYPHLHSAPDWLLNPPFYINIRQAGFHANAAVCVLVGFLYRSDLKIPIKIAAFIFLIMLWSYLFWTGGRASSLSALISVLLVIVILMMLKQKITSFVILLLAAILAGFLLAEYMAVLPINGLLSIFERNVSGGVNAFSSGRLEIWKDSFAALENNWIFGLGAESYMFLINSEGEKLFSTQPHNVIVQFLVEWGVVGLFLSSLLLTLLFYKGFKNFVAQIQSSNAESNNSESSNTGLKITSFMIIISFSITGLADGTFYHGQTVVYLLLAFAIWLLPEPLSISDVK